LSLAKKIGQKLKRSMERTQKEYFLREQMKAIQTELGVKAGKGGEVEELREKIEQSGRPEETIKAALKELERYEKLPSSSSERGVIRNYIDLLLALP
ncbi:endopeptidase La, partial [Bacillus cereus]|nr:endopeptidase La [Bacillus cereus]